MIEFIAKFIADAWSVDQLHIRPALAMLPPWYTVIHLGTRRFKCSLGVISIVHFLRRAWNSSSTAPRSSTAPPCRSHTQRRTNQYLWSLNPSRMFLNVSRHVSTF